VPLNIIKITSFLKLLKSSKNYKLHDPFPRVISLLKEKSNKYDIHFTVLRSPLNKNNKKGITNKEVF